MPSARVRAALLLVAVLLAGCANAPAPSTAPSSSERPCEPVRAHADASSLSWRETLRLRVMVSNCGSGRMLLYREPDCPGGGRVWLSAGGATWSFVAGDDTPRLPGANAGCTVLAELAPDQSHTESWTWDGSVAWRLEDGSEVVAPAPAGNITFFAANPAGGVDVQVPVLWQPPTCARLEVAATPREFRAGEATNLAFRLANCSDAPLPVRPNDGCGGGLQAQLVSGDSSWTVDHERQWPYRYVGMVSSKGYCIGAFGTLRGVLAPGAALQDSLVWNGTMAEDDVCRTGDGSYRGCTRAEVAPPGTYELRAAFAPWGGDVIEAAPVEVAWRG